MPVFMLFAQLAFGGDVESLGDPHFGTRHTADIRLRAAGWLAYPAVLEGLQSDSPEMVRRCEDIVAALPRDPLAVVAWWLIDGRCELPADEWAGWEVLRPAVAKVARGYCPLPVVSDCGMRKSTVDWPNLESWMANAPYYGGSPAGEVRVVVHACRVKRAGVK